jgi:hypothetical protein
MVIGRVVYLNYHFSNVGLLYLIPSSNINKIYTVKSYSRVNIGMGSTGKRMYGFICVYVYYTLLFKHVRINIRVNRLFTCEFYFRITKTYGVKYEPTIRIVYPRIKI